MTKAELKKYLNNCNKSPKTLDLEIAEGFLSWAIKENFYTKGLPVEPTVILSEVNLFVEYAFQAYKAKSENENILVVLNKFVELEQNKKNAEKESTESFVEVSEISPNANKQSAKFVVADEVDESSTEEESELSVSDEVEENDEQKEIALKVPSDSDNAGAKLNDIINIYTEVVKDAPVIPHDFTQLSDIELRQLYSACTQFYVYNAWLATLEENKCVLSETASKARMTLVMNSLPQIGANNKAKTSIRLKEEASNDVEYRRLNAELVQNKIVFRNLKSIADTYKTICEHLSREWTMRTDRDKISK